MDPFNGLFVSFCCAYETADFSSLCYFCPQILAFILIRNIPGYARSLYSSFFAWFGKISLEVRHYKLYCKQTFKSFIANVMFMDNFNVLSIRIDISNSSLFD